MNPGKKPHRAIIKAPVTTPDELKNQITDYEELFECWARLETVSGREYFAAAQMQAETTHKVILDPGSIVVLKSYVVEIAGLILEIEAVLSSKEPRSRDVIIMCKEKALWQEYPSIS